MRYILFSLFMLFSVLVFAQEKVNLDITVLEMSNKKKLDGVTVTVFDGTKKVASSVTTKRGTVNLDIPAGPMYKVVFTKAGKVTRFFNIDSKGIDMELIQGSEMPFVYGEVSLFDDVQGVDFSYVKDNPFTVFKFDGKSPNLAFDQGMANRMTTKIEQLLTAAEQQAKNNEVQYNAKMKEGEALATQKKYQEAMVRFEQALMFKPQDKLAMKRIDDMEKLLMSNEIDIVSGAAHDDAYDQLVKEATDLAKQKKYQDAIDKLEEALKKKPGDLYCFDEIERLEKIVKDEKDAAKKEEDYKKAMALGEQMLKQKSYETALKRFEEALLAKPNDPTATAKLKEVQKFLNAEKEAKEAKAKYEKLVAEADDLFNQESWELAKDKYEEAYKIESASTYVSGRIKLIKEKLDEIAKAKEKQEKIEKLLADGNALFGSSKWTEAKAKYEEVLKLDDKNETAKGQLKLINEQLEAEKEAAEQEKNFLALVKEGDQFVTGKKFKEAIDKYTAALALKADAEVQGKIDAAKIEIDKIENAAKIKQQYDDAIKQGQELLAKEDWMNARAKFVEATTLDDSQKLPKDKIAEIDAKLEKLKAEELKKEQFEELLAQGEALFGAKDYQGAKAKYEEAKVLDKASPIPTEKIKQIDEILAQMANEEKLKADIESWMTKADASFAATKFEEAIASYQKVLELDKDNSKATAQIEASKQALEDAKNQEALAQRKAAYDAAIAKGDELKGATKLDEAIVAYEEAKKYTDDPSTASQKIAAIKELLADAEKAAQAKELQEKYQLAFNKAEQFKNSGEYDQAITAYKEAKAIDSTQTLPDERINEIQVLLDDAEKAKELERQKVAQISALMEAGDALLSAEKYEEAIAKYKELKEVDPTNAEVDAKIAQANKLLSEKLAQQSAEELLAQYEEAFKEGMDFYANNSYDEAITAFTKAKNIDPTKEEPQKKIDEINALKQQLSEQREAEELAQKYNAYIEEGDGSAVDKNYEMAIAAYRKASALKPDEDYPKKKIAELEDAMETEQLLKDREAAEKNYQAFLQKGDDNFSLAEYQLALEAYNQAKNVKNTDEVREKIAQTTAKIEELAAQNQAAELEKQYAELLVAARTLEETNKLEEAIDTYKRASRIKENEQLPKDKIAELTEKLAAQKEAQAIENKYNLALAKGKEQIEKEEFNEAIKSFNEALEIKPNEKEPKDLIEFAQQQIKNISSKDEDVQFEKMLQFAQQNIDEKNYDKALELITRAESNRPNDSRLLAMKKEVQDLLAKEEKYKELIVKADAANDAKDYAKALDLYSQASEMKPSATHPVNKIAEIKQLLAAAEQKASSEEQFNKALADAIGFKEAKKYNAALEKVNEALALKPTESAAGKLKEELQELIADALLKRAANALEDKFKKALADADNLFESRKWTDAKLAYEKAQVIQPGDTYVKAQIERCTEEIANDEIRQSKYRATVAIADADYKDGKLEKAKSGYELALTFSNTNYAKDQIAKINSLLFTKNSQTVLADGSLSPLGEEIDLVDGAFLLAQADALRRTAKGEIVKEKKKTIVEQTDSLFARKGEFLAENVDTLKKMKGIELKDLEEYYERQFEDDKEIRNTNYEFNELYTQKGIFNHEDRIEFKRQAKGNEEIKIQREKGFLQHHDAFNDSLLATREITRLRYEEYTNSDYEFLMSDRETMKHTKDLQEAQIKDESEKYDRIVDLTKEEKQRTVDEYDRQRNLHSEKIDKVVDSLAWTAELERERNDFFIKDHQLLIDKVKSTEEHAITVEHEGFNNAYIKHLKAKAKVKEEEERMVAQNTDYLENKSLDIDKSRNRLNQYQAKYESDLMSDDEEREDARLFLKRQEKTHELTNRSETTKGEEKVDGVLGVAKKEQVLHEAATIDKKEKTYDTRQSLKTLEVTHVKYPPKVANSIGKNYPEGVSQETFKENGPDGLVNAIITRRIVVQNGHGAVYTRTQKVNSITYSKNGEPCTEAIWRNETTGAHLEKHF